jgi:hypothetical protein
MSDDDQEPGWFERKENQNKLWYVLLAVAGILAVADFLYEHHPHFEIDKTPGFFALFGFFAFVFIVFAGTALRKLIMRPEDYYDRD